MAYLREFIKDKNVAAILPTSSFAIRRAFNMLDLPSYKTVVEYGAGEGVITRRLLKILSPESRLIAIETNPQLIEELRGIDDPRLLVVHDSAENVLEIMKSEGLDHVDCIISGIPFTFLKKNQRSNLVNVTKKALNPEGIFLVYQNSFYAVKYLGLEFPHISKSFEPRNIPPLFLMRCSFGNG